MFGRGIDFLLSKSEHRDPSSFTFALLHMTRCVPLFASAPVKYIREAVLCTKTLSVNTNFFIDHNIQNQALDQIASAMYKQGKESWLWPFGDLAEGHEYLCVLDSRFDHVCKE